MKQSLLILITLLLTGASMAQFSDTAQLNSYIRDTIRDRRPEKVTAAQIQKALKGLSNLSSNYNAEIKAKYLSIIARDTTQIVNAKVIFDSLYLGGLSPNNRLLYSNAEGKVMSSTLEQTNENLVTVNSKIYISDTTKIGPLIVWHQTNPSTNINRTWFTTADSTRDIILQTKNGGGIYMRGSHAQATERGGIDVEYHTANSANASFKIWNVNNLGTYTRKFEVQNNWTYLGNRLLVGSTSDDGSNILQITGKARFSDTVKAMGEVLLPNIQTTTGNTHILTVDGNGVVSKSLPQHYTAPVTLVESTGAATWNLSLSNIATLSISDDVNLTMTSAQPGQEGKLIVEVTNPGSTINFPAGSLRTISDLDYVGLDNIEVSTKVGFDGSGSPLNGKWICSFLFDGTNYYWNIKRVTTF